MLPDCTTMMHVTDVSIMTSLIVLIILRIASFLGLLTLDLLASTNLVVPFASKHMISKCTRGSDGKQWTREEVARSPEIIHLV